MNMQRAAIDENVYVAERLMYRQDFGTQVCRKNEGPQRTLRAAASGSAARFARREIARNGTSMLESVLDIPLIFGKLDMETAGCLGPSPQASPS